MNLLRYANLAAMPLLFLLTAIGPLPEPLKVKFQLADGVRISGEMTAWDADGFDGSFGRRKWSELSTDDLWKVYQRVMDQQSAEQWVELGGVLLNLGHRERKAAELAERAFARALRLDEAASTRIDQVREQARLAERQRRQNQQQAEQARLKTTSPEADPWPADPWPVLSDAEHNAAVLAMRADAQERMQRIGVALVPVETEHFLIFTDLPRTEAAHWAVKLEKACEAFGLVMAPAQPPAATARRWFWGKAVIFVFQEQDRFRLMEVESFRQLVPQAAIAMCHPVGSKVFICAHKDTDEEDFKWMLTHSVVQGILHGYRTPRRLPPWANDGLAEYIATLVLGDSTLGSARRRTALDFIRTGGNVNALLDFSYAEQTWPGQNQIGLPIGSLIVELLIQQKHAAFIEWVHAVKQGEDWQPALRAKLGISRESLVETFVQYFKVND